RILDWDRRALVIRVKADAFTAQVVEPRRNALEWDRIDLGPRAQDVVEGVHTPKDRTRGTVVASTGCCVATASSSARSCDLTLKLHPHLLSAIVQPLLHYLVEV